MEMTSTKNLTPRFKIRRIFGTDNMVKRFYITCIRGTTNVTIGIALPSRVLPLVPLVEPMAPVVPILPTIGCHFCRQYRAWAKLPTRENDVIQVLDVRRGK